MMAHRRLWLASILLSIVALACNTLTSAFSDPDNQVEIQRADIQVAVELTVAALEPSATEAPIQPTAIQESSDNVEESSSLPITSLGRGTNGFIFSSQQISTGDRDIWWNRSEIVFNRPNDFVSLGMIENLNDVTSLSTEGMIEGVVEPTVGEGFGIRIMRDDAIQYALIRVISLEDRILTFEWVYPFQGEVIEAP